MNYTLNQLKIFLKIAERGSITKAADELHLTQPAVSNQLKNFQDQFDIPLTELVGRKIYITDFGKEIAQSAEKILNEVAAIDFKTHAYKGQLTGRLKISIVSTGKYVMPYFLSSFMGQHPGIELQMDVTNKEHVIGSLEENTVDFSLVSLLPSHLKVEKLDLLENKLYLIRNTSELDTPKKYTRELFKNLPLIYREQGSATRQVMENFFDQQHVTGIRKMELTSNEAVKQAVLAGLGYSLMPLIGIRKELLAEELQIIPMKGLPITTTWRLVWPSGKNHSPVAQAFLDYLRREKETIIKDHFGWCEVYG